MYNGGEEMDKKMLNEKKKILVKELTKNVNRMVIGSLYQTKVNCGISTCKKCQNNEKGHLAHHLGYTTSDGKHKTTYISKKLINQVKDGNKYYKETKKIIQNIAEVNLLIMKVKE